MHRLIDRYIDTHLELNVDVYAWVSVYFLTLWGSAYKQCNETTVRSILSAKIIMVSKSFLNNGHQLCGEIIASSLGQKNMRSLEYLVVS